MSFNSTDWPTCADHSMTIGGKHTFLDWGLMPAEIPVFAQAAPALSFEEVPGASGALDYTEVLSGEIPYQNREGSFEFIVLPGQSYETVRSTIANFLAGKRLNCVLDDDTTYFYTGRFWLNEAQSNRGYGTIVISYVVDPYKYSNLQTGSMDWLWNDLFNTTIYYGTFTVSGTKARNLINPSGSAVTPKFTCSSAMVVTKGGTTYNLPAGTTTNPGFTLAPGNNNMTFAGNGTVLVDYSIGKSL